MMRLYSYKMTLVCVAIAMMTGGGQAKADYTFGEATNLGPEINSEEWELTLCLSADGLELYFASERDGGIGHMDLYVSTRPTTDDPWGSPQNLGPVVNSPEPYEDMGPCLSPDGLQLYFQSGRPGGQGAGDIWVTRRITREDPWGEPENMGPPINSEGWDYNPSLSSDGLELYFALGPADEIEPTDLVVSRRETTDEPWGVPVNLGPVVNNWGCQDTPWISSDGLLLMYTDFWLCDPRPGGFGGTDIWLTRRMAKEDDWTTPMNLGALVNTEYAEDAAMISSDGSMLYFSSDRPGGSGTYDLWQVPILAVVDFDADESVGLSDLEFLIESWGTNEPLCDIGPMPWGDGVVDIEDLKVFIKHWEEANAIESEEVQ